MPFLVHITAEKNIKSILRTGLRSGRANRWRQGGVFCMPVLQDYFLTHQWVREMRRHVPGRLMAVYFRLDSQELAQVGYYGKMAQQMTLAQAIHSLMTIDDPQGYEIVILRSILPAEIHAVRHVRPIVGWRYMPHAHGKPFCTCPSCIPPGQIKGRKLRAYYKYAMHNNLSSMKGNPQQ